MARLCKKADIITPNLTEACFLTRTDYKDTSMMNEKELLAFATELCKKLSDSGAKKTVITGMHTGNDKLCVCGNDNVKGDFFSYVFPRINKDYPGTGDLFASVLLGSLLRNESFEDSIHLASDFTCRVMKYSAEFNTPEREGVAFEAFLGELAVASPII